MKTKSKSLISIILSIMMVLSMVIVAVPANAATVDTDSVGASYYLWYSQSSDNPTGYSSKVQLTSSGSNYVATVSLSKSNFYFLINSSSSSATSSLVWSSSKKPTVTKDSNFESWTSQSDYGGYIIVKGYTGSGSMTVTFNPTANTVDLTVGATTTTYTVTKTTPTNGSFTVSPTSDVEEGDTVTISSISPASGYEVDAVTVTDASGNDVETTPSGSNYTFAMPASNVTVTVTFRETTASSTDWYIGGVNYYDSTYNTIDKADATYKMTSEGDNVYTYTYTFKEGTNTLYVVINDGTTAYHPAQNSTDSNGAYPATIEDTYFTESPSWQATYASGTQVKYTWNSSTKTLTWEELVDETTYTVEVSNTDTNGTVACTTTSAKAGETVNFTVTPIDGYTINTVTVTGATVNKVSSASGTTTYSFTMPAQNVTISATFKVKVDVSSKWSLVGSFNDWIVTENPLAENSDGTYSTSIYLPANSTGFEFKLLDNEPDANEHAYYGKLETTITDSGSATLDNGESVPSDGNIVLKTTGGVYTFTWKDSTLNVSVAKSTSYTLASSATIPDSVGVGETLNMTINAEPSTDFPTTSYYKYTVKAGSTNVAKGVQNASTSYTCKTTLSADTTITYFVKAYSESGELLGLSATGSKDVTATISDYTVDITSDNYEIDLNSTITLTATVSPSHYAGSYEFFVSKDSEQFTSLGTSTTNTKDIVCSELGTLYYKVVVTNKYDTSITEESYTIEINVYEAIGEHPVDIYFKSASSFIYVPTLTYEGTAYTMTRDFDPVYDEDGKLIVQPYIGDAYSGSLKFYWYKTTVTLDSSRANTITFTTGRTQVNASFTGKFHGDRYFFAVDNLMSDKVALDITNAAEYIRNFYHSPLNMVSMGDTSDANLGFTNVGGTTYKMGSYLTPTVDTTGATTVTASFSIKSATAAQKVAAEIEEVSDLQYGLLDVNLDGNVDVRDATLMQKALVNA